MKATENEICCICGETATARNFAGDGFCPSHLASWKEFVNQEQQSPSVPFENRFQTWQKLAKSELIIAGTFKAIWHHVQAREWWMVFDECLHFVERFTPQWLWGSWRADLCTWCVMRYIDLCFDKSVV